MSKTIRIACQAAHTLPLDTLVPFQGNLKDLSKANYQRLRKEILTDGFSAPFFVWLHDSKHYILDGHQRLRTLQQLQDEGYTVPELPVAWVTAANVKEARRKVLALTSQYGNMTGQGLYEFMAKAELNLDDIDDFRFPEIDLDDFKSEFFADPPSTGGDETPDPPSEAEPYRQQGPTCRTRRKPRRLGPWPMKRRITGNHQGNETLKAASLKAPRATPMVRDAKSRRSATCAWPRCPRLSTL